MSIIQQIITEAKQEITSTKELLSRIPADKFEWQPHKRSMTLKALASHIVDIQSMIGLTLENESYLDLAEAKKTEITSTEDLVNGLENGQKFTLSELEKAEDTDLDKPWELRFNEQVLMKTTKGEFIRKTAMSHLYHHRGQLSVYLRLLDVAIPGIYGPSADEK